MQDRMARYDVRNDGVGPYAVFFCDRCGREFRTQPDVKATLVKDAAKGALGGLLRNVPVLGDAVSNINIADQRYVQDLSADQIAAAWRQMKDVFHECPTCRQFVCPTDWDATSGFCADDTPRRQEIAQAQGEQAATMVKGLANAFGLGTAMKQAADTMAPAPCAQCGGDTRGSKFCPNCGTPVPQAAAGLCRSCGADTHGAKFCPECGTKQG